MLLGLNDVHDEMVQATLRALADLVELMGGETVMGTARSNIFADAAPRVRRGEGDGERGRRGGRERLRDSFMMSFP